MKQTIGIHEFRAAFQNSSRAGQFSYEALGLIFDQIEEYENDSGEELEFDIVGICCDYSESTLEEAIDSYSLDLDPETATPQAVAEALYDAGSPWAVPCGDGVVYWQF